ncbi:GntR family transcriptional regulator [Actinoallomurus iriomotensis]|uniref:GntR family transcriptional regulator n=1 Tax=Actinoallomurus iriomotensis TaxID=478107 RepID=A0A9W6S843_9ACTN|nr:GntR family transcriptional regulator [Actinoallomurus iriomotensis]GLY87497.1 GntR family transcriptional regulator [Actinoallomurus iriomotensis]
MILLVETDSDVPLYQQLRDRVVEAIAGGELRAGDSLPTTRQLAADLGINMHTVNKAYDRLRHEGFIRLARRTGAVVVRDPATGPPGEGVAAEWEARARTLLAEAVAQGLPGAEIERRCQAILDGFRAGSDAGSRS